MDGAGDDGDLSRRRQPSPHHRRRPKPTPTRSAGLEEEITTAHEVKPKLKRRKKQLSGSDRLDDKQARDVDDADEAAAAELSTSVAQKILTTAREQVRGERGGRVCTCMYARLECGSRLELSHFRMTSFQSIDRSLKYGHACSLPVCGSRRIVEEEAPL